MNLFKLSLVVVGIAILLPTTGFAQSKGKAKAGRTLSFEDDVVEANFLRPDVTVIDAKSKDKRASLIRIRTNFFAEIYRSAEDL